MSSASNGSDMTDGPNDIADALVEHVLGLDAPDDDVEALLEHLETVFENYEESLATLEQRLDAGASRESLRDELEALTGVSRMLLDTLESARRRTTVPDPEEATFEELLDDLEARWTELDVVLHLESPLPDPLRAPLYHAACEAVDTLGEESDTEARRLEVEIGPERAELALSEVRAEASPTPLDAPDEDWSSLREQLRQFGGHLAVETSWREGTTVRMTVPFDDESSPHRSASS